MQLRIPTARVRDCDSDSLAVPRYGRSRVSNGTEHGDADSLVLSRDRSRVGRLCVDDTRSDVCVRLVRSIRELQLQFDRATRGKNATREQIREERRERETTERCEAKYGEGEERDEMERRGRERRASDGTAQIQQCSDSLVTLPHLRGARMPQLFHQHTPCNFSCSTRHSTRTRKRVEGRNARHSRYALNGAYMHGIYTHGT